MGSKRVYHPLVVLCYVMGELSDEYVSDIPKSTLSYWRNMQDHKNLHGYDWVAHFFDSVVETRAVAERKMGKKVVRLMSRVYCCYDRLIDNMKGYKKTVKTHAHTVINTIDHLSDTVSLSTACRFLRITTHQYYRLKNKLNCTASVLNLCFRTHPQQLTTKEVSVIKKGLDDPYAPSVFRSDIYYHLLRQGKLACSLSTFYGYAALLVGNVLRKKKPKEWTGFKASSPFEYLHIDTTFVTTDQQGKIRVAFVKDNYSKSILHGRVLPNASSAPIRELLQETFEKYELIPPDEKLHIVSDGGSENKGEVNDYIARLGNRVVKLTARQPEFPESNSMVESTMHQFKNVFLKNKSVLNDQHLLQQVLAFMYWNDHQRYPTELMGYTPFEPEFD